MINRLFHLCMLALLFTSVSACRFGNYAEPPKPNFKSSYKSVDLYFTEPKSLITAAVLDDNSVHENLQAPLLAIPASVRNVFTNPTYFAVPNNPAEAPLFVGLNESSYLSTKILEDGTIDDLFTSPVSVLWDNQDCLTQIEIEQKGTFDLNQPGSVTYNDGSSSPVKGHLKLKLSYTRVISGDCAADLQRLADCYTNGLGCSSDELNAASNLYDMYVRQTGVLNIANAIRVKGLAYEVQFE